MRALCLAAAFALWACAPAAPSDVESPPPPPPPVGEVPDPEPEPAEPTEPEQPPPVGEPAAGSGAEGDACTTGDDCLSGICEGEGCDPGEGVCAAQQRACTRDLRPYCGCDGQTFRASGSCPMRRYAYRGECKP